MELVSLDIFNHEVSDDLRKFVDKPVNEDLLKKNKYANNSEYISESVYKRILNKISDHRWSFVPHAWETIGEGKAQYIQFVGLLIVPGFGIHTGVGTSKLDKKDNSNALSAAKTYAFKNACKEMGLAPNVGDKDYDEEEPIFEEEIEETPPPKKKKKKKAATKVKDTKKKDSSKKDKPKKKKQPSLDDQIEEVREAYELTKDDDFVAFIQIWDEDVVDLGDMEDDDWDEFFDYLEKNKEEFEEF